MRVPVEPRPLNARERAVAERILQVDFPGAVELRHLSGLEYAWYGDAPPTSLPEVDRMVTS